VRKILKRFGSSLAEKKALQEERTSAIYIDKAIMASFESTNQALMLASGLYSQVILP